MHTINIRVTHHKADIPTLEAMSFPDNRKAMLDIAALSSVKECVVIQTCNRVEIFAAAEDVDVAYHEIIDYMMTETMSRMKQQKATTAAKVPIDQLVAHVISKGAKFHDVLEVEYHAAALHHLLRLTSGLESMIVGEDQILGQVRDSYQLAWASNTIGPFFKNIFSKAVNVGKRVRKETKINKGAVSIGSAAVELAESVLGSLEGKKVLLIGAGEMGTLVAKSLSGYNLDSVVVANRTYERGLSLAKELNGKVIKFKEVTKGIKNADLVITATGAPKTLLTKDLVLEAIQGKKKNLIIIDVAIPRDAEEDVGEIQGVKLFNIDGLREVAEKNRQARGKEAIRVEEILEGELSLLEKQLYHIDVEGIVKAIFGRAEHIRQKELEKASKMFGNGINEKDREILNDLTKVIINRTMSPVVDNIRKAAETGDDATIKLAEKVFLKELHHKHA
ncbi:MAG: glutamyl-tRNA reductase [Candidatus Hydrothermarchaeales archaeon]